MSIPHPQPHPEPRPQPRPRRKPAARPSNAPEKAPWGRLEAFLIVQTLMPVLLFIPGVSNAARTPIRIGTYLVGLMVWGLIGVRGTKVRPVTSFPARPWLFFCIGWLFLSLLHPNSYSPVAALAQVMLYVSVMSPAFWGGAVLESPRQMNRMMAILFLSNAVGSAMGVGQVYYPDRFNPPVIPAMSNAFGGTDLMYETADGRMIFRPCGLTDTPGGGAPAGAAAALLGLCWVLRPIPWWRRVICAGMALAGVAVIYYTQVRSLMVMLVVCFAVLTTLLTMQGNVRSALVLLAGGATSIVIPLAWVARTMGAQAFERFGTLLTSDPGDLYGRSRGNFVSEALGKTIWEAPLGTGMGWWGMIYGIYGDATRISPVWVEVMIPALVVDGGFPLTIAYTGAVLAAMFDSARIAIKSRDRNLAFWAAVIVAMNMSVIANCFSFVTFLSPTGIQFWLLAATLHAADARRREADGQAERRRPRPRPRPRLWPGPQGVPAT